MSRRASARPSGGSNDPEPSPDDKVLSVGVSYEYTGCSFKNALRHDACIAARYFDFQPAVTHESTTTPSTSAAPTRALDASKQSSLPKDGARQAPVPERRQLWSLTQSMAEAVDHPRTRYPIPIPQNMLSRPVTSQYALEWDESDLMPVNWTLYSGVGPTLEPYRTMPKMRWDTGSYDDHTWGFGCRNPLLMTDWSKTEAAYKPLGSKPRVSYNYDAAPDDDRFQGEPSATEHFKAMQANREQWFDVEYVVGSHAQGQKVPKNTIWVLKKGEAMTERSAWCEVTDTNCALVYAASPGLVYGMPDQAIGVLALSPTFSNPNSLLRRMCKSHIIWTEAFSFTLYREETCSNVFKFGGHTQSDTESRIVWIPICPSPKGTIFWKLQLQYMKIDDVIVEGTRNLTLV